MTNHNHGPLDWTRRKHVGIGDARSNPGVDGSEVRSVPNEDDLRLAG
jgi:hypothetical protein